MPRCTHKGCGKEYDEADNAEGSCSYHPGAPVSLLLNDAAADHAQVFHEGLKSWCERGKGEQVLTRSMLQGG